MRRLTDNMKFFSRIRPRQIVALLMLCSVMPLFAGEYTNTFRIRVKAKGESLKGDPVESFNSAVEYAKQSAESQGGGVLRGRSASRDAVLDEIWIKKEANIQVVDLKVLNYRFWRPQGTRYGNSLVTDIEADITLDYLDVPSFMEDYEKTVMGATYRSMAIPGWGQFYNNQHTTGVLYGFAFWLFYGLFINAVDNADGDSSKIDEATLNYQIPAMVFWTFNVSEAATSRYLGKQGLESLRAAYRLEPRYRYESMTERGFKIDLILFQVPLYKLWRDD